MIASLSIPVRPAQQTRSPADFENHFARAGFGKERLLKPQQVRKRFS
jgi:hypothetical protein